MLNKKDLVFNFAQNPKIVFGQDTFGQLIEIIQQFGNRVLIVTGSSSFRQSKTWETLDKAINNIRYLLLI